MTLRLLPATDAPGGPAMQQHPRHAEAMARFGRPAQVMEWNDVRALVLTRRLAGATLALSTRPPAIPAEGWRAFARALPFGALAVTAEDAARGAALRAAGFAQIRTAAHLAELDLTLPEPERRARAMQKWRNRLVHAEAQRLKIRRSLLPPDPAHPALIEEALQRRARRYAGLPTAFAAAWASVAPGAAVVFEATSRGAPVARMLFLLHPPGASYFLGWTSDAGRRLSAHNLVLWRAAEWLATQGVATLDLGAVDTEAAPGLARFKLGCGAAPRALGGTWLHGPGSRFFA